MSRKWRGGPPRHNLRTGRLPTVRANGPGAVPVGIVEAGLRTRDIGLIGVADHEFLEMLEQRDMRLLQLNLQALALDVLFGARNQIVDAAAGIVVVFRNAANLVGEIRKRN